MKKYFECHVTIFIGNNIDDMSKLSSHLNSLGFNSVMSSEVNYVANCNDCSIKVHPNVAKEAQTQGWSFIYKHNLDVTSFEKALEDALSK